MILRTGSRFFPTAVGVGRDAIGLGLEPGVAAAAMTVT